MTIKISEQRTKEGYEITFFTDNKSLFRKSRILLDKLSSKERKRNMVCETEEENNFTISEFDPIIEMIKKGEELPPLPDEVINV